MRTKSETKKHRTRYPPLVVVVPPRLRAVVVATALVCQTRGSFAFLGFGARTLISTLGDAACPVCASKGVTKTTAPGVAGAGISHARRNSNDTSVFVKAFGRQRRAVGEPGVPRRLGCLGVRKVGDVAFAFVFLSVLGLFD